MPTYDYVCDACEHAFEHFQSMSSNRLRTCPECKKRKLRRLIGSGAGVIFKGGGFYETDYKRKSNGKQPSDSSSASESASDSKSSESANDSKPKGKSDASKGSSGSADSGSDSKT